MVLGYQQYSLSPQRMKTLAEIPSLHLSKPNIVCHHRDARPNSRWLPVRSHLEALRTWASLIAVGRFAESVGSLDTAVMGLATV